ncbi:MAG: response regulator [Candidatus Helarchaeales archaeon]
MKPLILLVEDNSGVALNIKISLEFNNFDVVIAANGSEALQKLREMPRLPDLIISDIMMPEMDGYEFFMRVSENEIWNQIPFIFLSARASPEDVRMGKMLGIDDYITKPFKEEDLLAIVTGKIAKWRRTQSISKRLQKQLEELKIILTPSISVGEKERVFLALFQWDEALGPVLEKSYPEKIELPRDLQTIGTQLFVATASIFGQENLQSAQGILIPIENISMYGYVYFDSVPDEEVRGGYRRFMLTLIAPRINYMESLKIRNIFIEVSDWIKTNEPWNIKETWEKIIKILSTPVWKN